MRLTISLICAAVFAVTGVVMCRRAHFMATRRVAGVAFAMAGAELLMAGALDLSSAPAVAGALFALRAALLVCCVCALRRDRERAKARARLRSRFAADMANTLYPLRLLRHKNNVSQVDAA